MPRDVAAKRIAANSVPPRKDDLAVNVVTG